jgi:hypothetical protein
MKVYFLSFFFGFVIPSECASQIIYSNSFEENFFIKKDANFEACCEKSIITTRKVSKTGKNSLRFELNDTDSNVAGGKRSEMIFRHEKTPNIDRWYKFNTYFSYDYGIDSIPESIAQWHEIPDWNLGETWRSPPISLQTKNGFWYVVVLWASEKVNSNKSISGQKIFKIGKVETGSWEEWVFRIKFSYQNKGRIQLWRKGKLVLDYNGPNYYNDKKGPFFKMGIYKWEWNGNSIKRLVNKRVLYIDDIIIGNEKSNLKIMRNFYKKNK